MSNVYGFNGASIFNLALKNSACTTNPTTSSAIPGTIIMHGGNTAPSGYLLCDGTTYVVALYPALYAVIARNFTTAYVLDQTLFQVPDMRGVYAGMPGTNVSSASDPQLTGLTLSGPIAVGDYQMQQTIFLNHNHSYTYPNSTSKGGEITGDSYYRSGSSQALTSGSAANPIAPAYATIGDVLRPTTLGINYIIKT
jgi:microcystin-dependent protein